MKDCGRISLRMRSAKVAKALLEGPYCYLALAFGSIKLAF